MSPYADPVVRRERARDGYRRRHAVDVAARKAALWERLKARPVIPADELAWAAGCFEGEGTFTITRTGGRTRPLVCLSSTDPQMTAFFGERWGGCFTWHSNRGPNAAPAQQWRLTSREPVAAFILDVLPHLRTERVRSKAYLLLADVLDRYSGDQGPAFQDRCWDRAEVMRYLNRKGPKP